MRQPQPVTLRDIISQTEDLSLKEEHDEMKVNEYREFFERNWKNLIFRRVGNVCAERENFVSACVSHYDEIPTVYYSLEELASSVDADTIYKKAILVYKYWYATTTKTALRDNDPYSGESIWFDSRGYRNFDMRRSFWFYEDCKEVSFKAKRPPRVRVENNRLFSDLVCGLVADTRKGPKFTMWFHCSEQFYKLWTMVMYEASDVYPRRNSPSQLLKKLRCNNVELVERRWAKQLLSIEDEEKAKKLSEDIYKHHEIHRTERDSGDWPGIYQAFARYVVYNEQQEDIIEKLRTEYNPDVLVEERELYPENLFYHIDSVVFPGED